MDINNKSENQKPRINELLTYDFIQKKNIDNNLRNTFNNLANDTYLKHKYTFRKRAFTKCLIDKDFNLKVLKTQTFKQDIRINKYAGGIPRNYPIVNSLVVDYIQKFFELNKYYFSDLKPNSEIGIHQIRITTINNNEGHPVPEGYHQDGVDYVIIIPIQSYGICGGINSIRYGSQDGAEILNEKLDFEKVLILNDRRVFHYASPIYAKYENIEGYRDSIILTIEKV